MHGVVGALFYLRSRSLANALVSRIKRLRQPKYLLGGIIGVAYVYFAFFRRVQMNGSRSAANAVPLELVPAIATLGAILLLVFVVLCWVWRRERASLNFSEAEIAFLFPAPITRNALIHYRLISVQMRVLVSATILALFSRSWSFLPGNWPMRFVGWWLIFATLSLHVVGSSFVLTKMLDSGMSVLRRQLVVLGVVAFAGLLIILWPADFHEPAVGELMDLPGAVNYLSSLADSGLLPWLLLPFKCVLGPLFAVDARTFFTALGPALLVHAIHYFWVLRNEVAFEESSVVNAAKRAARTNAMRDGNWRLGGIGRKARRETFDLFKARRPELAFLWKNLLSSREYLRLRTALIAAGIIIVGGAWLASHPAYRALRETLAIFAMMAVAYALVLGPQFARQDLRSDILNADILKTYPLRGWQIVLGEILTPMTILTVVIWLLLLIVTLTVETRQGLAWLTAEVRWAIAIALALITPLFCALQLIVVNAVAVLFPAWLQSSRGRGPAGIEVMGQRIFFVAGQFMVGVLALLPAAIAAALVYGLVQWLVNIPVAAVFAFLTAFAILGVEVGGALAWLGRLFERFDLSAELRP